MLKDLAAIQMASAKDVGCVSWILRSITDQEALDTAIRLAGMIRRFEDGVSRVAGQSIQLWIGDIVDPHSRDV